VAEEGFLDRFLVDLLFSASFFSCCFEMAEEFLSSGV
jgi:hypothetical protein